MNIKISIKDCDCPQSLTTNKELSEVEYKKRTMLYAPPEQDKHSKQTIKRIEPQGRKANTNINMNSK